jgi:hypothetical protein
MTLRTIAEITVCLGFAVYFLWSTGKIVELKQRLCNTNAAFLKAVTEHSILTAQFKALSEQVAVEHKEITKTFNLVLTQVAKQRAATEQFIN